MIKIAEQFEKDVITRYREKLAAFSEALAPDFKRVEDVDDFTNDFLARQRHDARAKVMGGLLSDGTTYVDGAGNIRRAYTKRILDTVFGGDPGPNNMNLREAKAMATRLLLRNADAKHRTLALNSNTATNKKDLLTIIPGTNEREMPLDAYQERNGHLGFEASDNGICHFFPNFLAMTYNLPTTIGVALNYPLAT